MGSKLGSGSGGPEQGSSSSSNSCNLTTFVQADPSTFRALVQKLTGADHGRESSSTSSSSSSPHLSNSGPPPPTSSTTHRLLHLVSPRRPAFKIQERRLQRQKNNSDMMRMRMMRNLKQKLEIKQPISTASSCHPIAIPIPIPIPKNNSQLVPSPTKLAADHDHDGQIISPVSTFLSTSTSPNTPATPTIANNHHPQLLPLFPLHSPKHCSPS